MGLALALAAGFAPASPQLIDAWYSDRWYRAIQPFVTGFSSLVPVALLDLLPIKRKVKVQPVLDRGARRGRTIREGPQARAEDTG